MPSFICFYSGVYIEEAKNLVKILCFRLLFVPLPSETTPVSAPYSSLEPMLVALSTRCTEIRIVLTKRILLWKIVSFVKARWSRPIDDTKSLKGGLSCRLNWLAPSVAMFGFADSQQSSFNYAGNLPVEDSQHSLRGLVVFRLFVWHIHQKVVPLHQH